MDENNNISLSIKNRQNENKRYFLNEEDNETSLLNKKDDNYNYIELFEEVVKSIDKIIFKKNENEDNNQTNNIRKNIFMYNSINEEEINYNQLYSESYNILYELYSKKRNILLLKNKSGNNLAQHYKNSGLLLVSLELINAYYKIYINEIDGEEKFLNWLINDNKEGENILEIGIFMQINPKEQIPFYKKIFEYIDKSNNKKIIYKIIENRENNIFNLCAKEEKLFLFLYFYEKIKKYYPSQNPLDIKNKLGYTPLHFSCYNLSRDITDNLLILDSKIDITDNNGNTPLHFAVRMADLSITKKLLLHGANKYQLNKRNETPIDIANKYGNDTMKNFFSNNPLHRIDKIKGKNYCNIFFLLFSGCFLLKFFIDEHFWKSYMCDIFCFLFFVYFILRKKDYYLSFKLNSKKTLIEQLLEKVNYDKNKVKRICPKCKIIKSLTTKHCMVCNKCVEDFDHHCFWINKCVNDRIVVQFFLFIIILLIDLITNLILFFLEMKNSIKETKDKKISFYIKNIFLGLYILITFSGIYMVSQILLERIKGILYSSNKKLYLEENLLNKKNDEDEDENKSSNDIKAKKDNKENNDIKIKEENKEDEIIIKNITTE